MEDLIKVINRQCSPHTGGRCFVDAFNDYTQSHTPMPAGKPFLRFDKEMPSDRAEDLADVCNEGDVAGAQGLIAGSGLSGPTTALEADLSFKLSGPRAAQTLAKALPATLEVLCLSLKGNTLQTQGIKAIAAALPKGLKTLRVDLGCNRIHLEGVEAFLKAIPEGVEDCTLGFHSMRLGTRGAKVIADHLPPRARDLRLDLYENQICDEGAVYLAKRLPKTLRHFELHILGENRLSQRGNWIFDHTMGDPDCPHNLPELKPEEVAIWNRPVYPEVRQYEISKARSELIQMWPAGQNIRAFD